MLAMANRTSGPTEPNIFGDNLTRLRKAAGMTQEQLALKAGLSRLSVSNLERGANTEPKRSTVEALAKALRVDPTEFSRGSAQPTTPQQQQADDPRISLDEFLSAAGGMLEPADIRLLQRLRTRLDPRGLPRRAWLRTVLDLREEDDGHVGGGGGTAS